MCRGCDPLYAALSVQQMGSFSKPGSSDPVLLGSGITPSLPSGPLTQF